MTKSYTQTYRLAKPDFQTPDWASDIQGNMDIIDAALRNLLMDVVLWTNSTALVPVTFEIGSVALDNLTNPVSYWICNVNHTTPLAPTTFAQDRIAHPTYWTSFSFGFRSRGAWANDTAYIVNDIAYDSVRGITGICSIAHTSNHAGTIVDDSANWSFIVNLPTVFTATATTYDHSVSLLAATNVQAAIDEINSHVAGAFVSSNISYDHTVSGMAAINVKTALDELKAITVANSVNIAANTTAITTGTIATGFMQWRPTNEALTGWILANGTTVGNAVSGGTQRANADTAGVFDWLWNNFSNTICPVSGGRGANSAADFAANKNITVIDMRGFFGGLGVDTMDGAASTRLSSVPIIAGSTTAPGTTLGENLHTNTILETPVITPTGSISVNTSVTNGAITSTTTAIGGSTSAVITFTGAASTAPISATAISISSSQAASPAVSSGTFTGNAFGNGNAHNNVPFARSGKWWIKL